MKIITFKKVLTISILLSLLLILVILVSITMGSVKVPPFRSIRILLESILGLKGGGSDTERTIILSLRLPRAILAGFVGAGLSISGATFQALLRNPLADPYILGVSSGAAVGAIIALLLGLSTFSLGLPLASFLGALLTILGVFYFGRQEGKIHPNTLLLAGVIIGSFLSALIMFFISVSQKEELHTIIFWLMGDFSFANPRAILIIFPYILLGVFLLYRRSRQLNIILSGEEHAVQLGVDVEKLKLVSYISASLITAASVSVCGLIGFVGLIIPHSVRLIFGPDHRLLIPSAALIGASFLIASDTFARTILSPTELPVGVITAAFGGPFFIYLLRTRKVIKTL
ncbi:MAG TPA: iron chelate uptake ABC transporter family permease subunit [Thermodesulfobacteriota bacterium]|jgi:iron complex transport system permease protein|nr:iron chelate uptake ABC transporter family permease subunit [Thermodesulfobacteriota bacterium]